MGREIKFCLLYRDMWQSSGKYMPRVDQLRRVAGPIVDMGCFSRIETNGGGFEQINLLYGENPNVAVREWTTPFNEAGIQTQMLERGLNGIRMRPVGKDLRKLMFKLKKLQGTDIARSFDGLNDPRNLELSIKYAKEGGMISQAALSLTYSKIHTVEYYLNLADVLIEMGAEEICLKDMAGIGRPTSIGNIVKGIKRKHPETLVQYHGHSGPGFSVASTLEAVKAGADVVDVGMEPLSWGTGHADLLTIHAMLVDAGFTVPDINTKAYMEVRSLTQEFIDDFLGYYINPRNRLMNSLLIGPGLPGGMMGSLMADLENNLTSLNKSMVKHGKPEVSQDELLIRLFDEVEFIWPKLGYPPLVTPFSQYVKNVALMNVLQMYKDKDRWTMIDDNTWDMILGKSGKLPGPVADEIKDLAISQGREFFAGNPQELYEDELEHAREEMKANEWEVGQDNEELFEFAMHPEQYSAYKSGKAKETFEADLLSKKSEKELGASPEAPATTAVSGSPELPRNMQVEINGEKFEVRISYSENGAPDSGGREATESSTHSSDKVGGLSGVAVDSTATKKIIAPIEGNFMLTKNSSEVPVRIGDHVKEGDLIGYIEAMKVYNAIHADKSGVVAEICQVDGSHVDEDDLLIKLL